MVWKWLKVFVILKYMERLQKAIKKFARVRLRKMHLDYLAGILSIPVLVTAIIINWGNLTHSSSVPKAATPTPQVIIVNQKSAPVSPSAVCQKTVGPISITSPTEGQTVNTNPVCITISYTNPNYCSVVWSYSINNGSWSDYNSNSPCLYNVPGGTVSFSLRVQSTVSNDTKTITRNFTYTGGATPTVTPTSALTTPAASSSAH